MRVWQHFDQVAPENAHVRAGGWQLTIGDSLHGKTLGVLGLGNMVPRLRESDSRLAWK